MEQKLIVFNVGPVDVLQIAGSSSWHARYTVLTYLQIMVFYNLFTFMSDQKAVNDVRALVIKLLEDEQLEVKKKKSHQLTSVQRLKSSKISSQEFSHIVWCEQ